MTFLLLLLVVTTMSNFKFLAYPIREIIDRGPTSPPQARPGRVTIILNICIFYICIFNGMSM